MLTLSGTSIYLRALEPEDLEFVHAIENDETIWPISNTQTPYSRYLIREYLKNARQDIYEAKQLRLAICKQRSFQPVGLVDLFDFDPKNNRAGIGILIKDEGERNQGIGGETLELLIRYSFTQLGLHQLYANIDTQNSASLKLFTKFGFVEIGVKKQWNLIGGKYRDEALFQLINNHNKK
ncbi:GNAT family N-acetyltransferase [Flavobacterium caeni]|uniref:Diamine N-acetyltransferase n=1 Tax=Flavobacterium caeni TaxID=490189 RepID=A0A1G5HIY2_9FLAO|nr:GNAT family protein [Flavobacterium caeni]SCY63746.1 diamine N-acetyltransferase [Flavobacterium caeni]